MATGEETGRRGARPRAAPELPGAADGESPPAAPLLAALRTLPGVFWIADPDLRVVQLEGARFRDSGGDPGAWVGHPLGELVGEENAATVEAAHRRALAGEAASYRIEMGGTSFEATVEPLREGGGGAITGCVGLAIDVTRERQARAAHEEEVRRRDRELATIADITPAVIARYDLGLRISFVNAAAAAFMGGPRERLLGRTPEEFGFPPAVAARWRADLERCLRLGAPVEVAYELETPHGARYLEGRAAPERDARGEVVGLVTVTAEVTERRRAELAAREADAMARAFFEQAEVGIGISDSGGRYVRVNPFFAKMLGYGPEELYALAIEDVTPREGRGEMRSRTARVLSGEVKAYTAEGQYLCKGGRRTWLRVNVSPLRVKGRPTHLIAVAQDVSRRKEVEDALRASEERFRALVENASDLISILDAQGVIRYASPSHEAVFGVAPEWLGGRSVLEFVHPDDREKMVRAFELAMARAGPARSELVRLRHADGSWRTLETVLHDLRAAPAVGGIVANSRDVTDQSRLEERLRQSQKLEALGQLAGGVAHDFNNILASVLMYARAIVDDLPPAHPRRADAEEILTAGTRGAAVVKQLLAFSRAQPLDAEVLELADAVRDTGQMLRALLPASIQLELPPEGGAPARVRASRAGVAQIVLNLAVNARDAMPEGGRLAIAVARSEGPHGPEAVLEVRDTGSGVPAELRDRIFDPFFTTKGVGEGTGLGLSTVYGLCRQFGGTVAVESEPDRGATFRVALPCVEGPVSAPEAPRPRPATGTAPPADRRRVLLVEDEPPIARVARRILERAGYAVVTEGDGVAALERVRRGERFDVVLTDAAMPRVNGWQLAAEVRSLAGGTPIVLMSGYAELSGTEPSSPPGKPGPGRAQPAPAGPGEGSAPADRFAGFLQKPFTPEELLEVLRRCLRRPG